MRTTIDAAGRVVVPKFMRRRLGIDGPAEVEIDERDGIVEIRRPDRNVTAVQGPDGRTVFVAPEGTPPLTAEQVRAIVEETRLWPRD